MNLFHPTTLFTFVFAAAVLGHGQTAPAKVGAAAWLEHLSVNASANATRVGNISRTSSEPTRKDATTYEFTAGLSQHRQLASSWLLELGADAAYLAVPKYERTNQLTAGPRLGLQHKFGLGPLAPVLQFDAAYNYKAALFAGDRGWTAEGGVRLAKRLLPTLKVAASSQWLEHYAASSIFDIQQHTLSGEVSWDLAEHWRLSGTVGRLRGTIVANAAGPVWASALGGGFGPTIANYYNSIPWTVTELYGPRWVSYNVAARADLWSLALAYALTEHSTLELRASSAFVVNHAGISYPTDSWGLGLLHRF